MDYDAIKKSTVENRPDNAEAIPWMYHFLRKFVGGKGMKLAKQILYFMRGEFNTARNLAAELWDTLAH